MACLAEGRGRGHSLQAEKGKVSPEAMIQGECEQRCSWNRLGTDMSLAGLNPELKACITGTPTWQVLGAGSEATHQPP